MTLSQRAKKLMENEYYDIPYETQKKYMKKTLVELMEELETLVIRKDQPEDRHPYVETTYIDYQEANTLELLIAERLSLFRGSDLLEIIHHLIEENEAQNKALETLFKNHRHCLDKTYGEKPVWG